MKLKHLPTGQRAKHPDRNFREAAQEAREADRVRNRKGIDKRFTALKAAQPDTKDADGGFESGVMHPSDDQLEAINRFTRSPKTAEEVVCFPTLSCNDIIDRDFDQFTTNCVEEFAALPEPYSSVGKSFMVGHDYNKLPVGRIFDVGTKSVDGQKYLTNWVYMPNTEANKQFIENVDYGINWAVSVGVMLGASKCAICESPVSSMFGFCYENGHMKGYYYNPDSDEVDSWGFPLECDPEDPKAQLCFTKMEEPRDFYELSQVFLGAQYFAALDDKSALGGIVKAASAAGVPIIGLSKEEAEELPIPHLPKQVKEAQEKYETTSDEEGQVYWTDDNELRWVYDPEEGEVLCLGRTDSEKEEDGDATTDEERQSSDEGASAEERESGELADGEGGGGQLEDEQQSVDLQEDEQPASVDEGSEDHQSDADAPALSKDDTEEGDDMSDKAVKKVAEQVKVPAELVEAAAAEGGPLLNTLLKRMVEEHHKLASKATLGDEYLKDLRAEALSWYVKANQDGDAEKPVKTETFQRILDACGDDVELIKSLIEEKKELAKAKFPGAIRRSTFESNANEVDEPAALPDDKSAEKVRKLHG